MIFLLFFSIFQPSNKLSLPIKTMHDGAPPHTAVNSNGIFLNVYDSLYQFDFNGNLLLKINAEKNRFQSIRVFYVSEDYIWIVDNSSLSSFFYDKKGSFLFQDTEVFSNNIQHLSDDIFVISPGFLANDRKKATPFLRYGDLSNKPYPKLLKTMELEITKEGIKRKVEIQSFYKAPESLSEVNLTFTKLWAFQRANNFTVINQVDNSKFVYSPLHLNQERQVPPDQPYQARRTPLNLPEFQKFSDPFKPKPFYEDFRDHRRDALCWLYSRSTIENIVPTNYGYFIGYTTPKEPCKRGHLVVAKTNRDFRLQTLVLQLDRHGIFMGVNKNKMYILVPNYKIEKVFSIGSKPEIWVFDLDS